MKENPELTEAQLARAIPVQALRRLLRGTFETAEDIRTLRRYLGLTQVLLARAMGVSVHTLRNWEQGRRVPEGPALALLRIAARHPHVLRERVDAAA